MVEPGLWWRVKQTVDTVTEGSRDYNWKSHYAKTVRSTTRANSRGARRTGEAGARRQQDDLLRVPLVVDDELLRLPSLDDGQPQDAEPPQRGRRLAQLHDLQLPGLARRRLHARHGRHGDRATASRPCAQVPPCSSARRIRTASGFISQQQTVSAEGFAGQAFNTHVPHTVRAKETKDCADCHVSKDNDNNAWLAQTYAAGHELRQLHGPLRLRRRRALARSRRRHRARQSRRPSTAAPCTSSPTRRTTTSSSTTASASSSTSSSTSATPKSCRCRCAASMPTSRRARAACASTTSRRSTTRDFPSASRPRPSRRFGQKFYVETKYATAVAAPSTLAVDPARWRLDREVGWFDPLGTTSEARRRGRLARVVEAPQDARTRRQPLGQRGAADPPALRLPLRRRPRGGLDSRRRGDAARRRPAQQLPQARARYESLSERRLQPGRRARPARTTSRLPAHTLTSRPRARSSSSTSTTRSSRRRSGSIPLNHPRAVAVQFRYAFVVDEDGLKVVDVTNPLSRRGSSRGRRCRFKDAHDVYVARTYAYVANGARRHRHRRRREPGEALALHDVRREGEVAGRSTTRIR